MGKIEAYNKSYPSVDIPDAQKEERQERIEVKKRRAEGSPVKYFVVPELPWRK